MNERVRRLKSVHVDDKTIRFSQGVLLVDPDHPSKDWTVIMFDVAPWSLTLIDDEKRLVMRSEDGLVAVGKASVKNGQKRPEYTCLVGTGVLRAASATDDTPATSGTTQQTAVRP